MDSTNTQEKIEINLDLPIWTFQKENVEEWKKQNIKHHNMRQMVREFNIEYNKVNENPEKPLEEREKQVNEKFDLIINKMNLSDHDAFEFKDPFIRVYDNVLSDNFCDFIIKKFESKKELHNMGRVNFMTNDNEDLYKKLVLPKKTTEIPIHRHTDIFKDEDSYINQQLNKYFEKYLLELSMPTNNFQGIIGFDDSGYQIQKYEKNSGRYYFHDDFKIFKEMEDNNIQKLRFRTLTFLFYLNDIEDGGETLFLDCKIKPKKGRLLFFPATWNYIHAGNIPKSDDKYIITGWFLKNFEFV